MSVSISAPHEDMVPPEVVSSVFYSATVSDSLAILVAEATAAGQRLTWCNEGAVQLLGYGLDDLRALPLDQLFPSLGGGELKLLLRRERAARMTLPVHTASGAVIEAVVITTPSPGGRMWTMRILSTSNEQERALRATADAHERRFSALTPTGGLGRVRVKAAPRTGRNTSQRASGPARCARSIPAATS